MLTKQCTTLFTKNKKTTMKKIITLIAICLTIAVSDLKAQTILWPSAKATAVSISATGTTSLTLVNNMSYVANIPTLTGNNVIFVTAPSYLRAGAVLHLVIKTTGLETTTFDGAIVAPVVTGAAGKTWSQTFIYNGTKFYPCGAKIQVD